MSRRLLAALAAALLLLLGTTTAAQADPNDISITLPGGNFGEDRTPLLTGTGDPLYPVHVLVNGVEATAVTPATDGTWSFQLVDPLPQGEQAEIRAQVRDNFDEVIAEAVTYYYVLPPVVPLVITEPSSGQKISGHFDLRATATDQGATYRIYVDGQPIDASIGFEDLGSLLAFVDLEDFADGPHQLQLRGKDAWGRQLASQVVDVVGDSTGPPKPVITSPAAHEVVTSHHVVISGTAVPGQELSVVGWESGEPACEQKTVVADADGRWSCDLLARSIDYLDGKRIEVHLTAWSYDEIGNRSNADMVPFILDLRATAPTPTEPAVPAPADPASAVPAAAAAPELANTGPTTGPGLAVALLLIAAGLALTTFSRRLPQH